MAAHSFKWKPATKLELLLKSRDPPPQITLYLFRRPYSYPQSAPLLVYVRLLLPSLNRIS